MLMAYTYKANNISKKTDLALFVSYFF